MSICLERRPREEPEKGSSLTWSPYRTEGRRTLLVQPTKYSFRYDRRIPLAVEALAAGKHVKPDADNHADERRERIVQNIYGYGTMPPHADAPVTVFFAPCLLQLITR